RVTSNENKMSDGGQGRASLGLEIWESSQKLNAQRSAVRSIAWLDGWQPFGLELLVSGDRTICTPCRKICQICGGNRIPVRCLDEQGGFVRISEEDLVRRVPISEPISA